MQRGWRVALGLGAAMGLAAGTASATGVVDPLERPAIAVAAPARAVLLDVTRAGSRLVAVGERGVVVLSDDGGQTWRQARVSTSVSLTGVAFPTPTHGWAIGHAGVVLHSADGGETWTKQLDGVAAARLALEAAQAVAERAGAEDEAAQRQLQAAQYLVDDGPDKPFLDLAFTDDGGQNWQPWLDRVDNPQSLHLYAIQIVGRTLYLAGEQGLFLRSDDGGEQFTRRETPYEGTFFTVAADAAGHVVLGGLRGHVFWSADRGETFQPAEVPIPVSLSAISPGEDDTLYFANQAGLLLASHDGGRTLVPLSAPHLPPLASLLPLGPEALLTVGWGGAIPVALNESTAATGAPGAAAAAGGAR